MALFPLTLNISILKTSQTKWLFLYQLILVTLVFIESSKATENRISPAGFQCLRSLVVTD